MFILGQLKDFMNLGKVASTIGTENGVIKYVADYKNSDNLKPFIGSAFKIHLFSSIVVCILTLCFNKSISQYLFNDSQYSSGIAILSFSFISMAIHSLIMSILNGLKRIKTYVIISVVSTLITAVIMVFLVVKYNIIGAVYAIAINQIVIVFVSLFFIRNLNFLSLNNFRTKIESIHFKNLTKFSIMAIVAPLCMVGSTFFVRLYINSKLGDQYAGSWEGMWRISAIYIMFLTTTFQFYLIPTFTGLSGKKLKQEVFKVWTLSVPSILVITLIVYLLKDFIITLLFTKEFLLINTIIFFHLLGDAVKINSWVLGKILVSKANTKIFIYFQIGWALIFCSLTVLLVKGYGFVGVSVAYFITYSLHFIAMNIYFRKLLWIKER
ncbi:MAG: PST family polysaccharide transporter [Psychroserpens sp.]|jgi:PST family polysaccharide transporter